LLTFRELGIVDRDILNLYNSGRVMPDYCDPTRDMDQCNLSKYISKLFTTIINEYVNLKQPSLYGVTVADKTDADLELQANDFSSEYFSGLQICDDSTQRLYPQTCRIMKGYIKHAGDLLADVRVFDVPTVLDTDITIGTCTATDPAFNLFLCGLYGDKSNSLQRFLNLSYNELFYYRLFISYYTLMLKSNASTILNIPQTSVNNELFTRITTFNNEFTWDQEAFSLTLRMMRDLYAAFPLHI